MYQGSCLCGGVKYRLLSEPKKASHCHCKMCQKQHGAAFATYVSLPKTDIVYEAGSELLVEFNSSSTINRKFCKVCGSNIEWGGSQDYPDWVSIALATFDTPYNPVSVSHIYEDSRVCWLEG